MENGRIEIELRASWYHFPRLADEACEGVCVRCGRRTAYDRGEVLVHGNPATPAADTEYRTRVVCAACGYSSY